MIQSESLSAAEYLITGLWGELYVSSPALANQVIAFAIIMGSARPHRSSSQDATLADFRSFQESTNLEGRQTAYLPRGIRGIVPVRSIIMRYSRARIIIPTRVPTR